MLEKLGNALKSATDKIANALFLDKNLVDSIIRELQRALIEADVSVILVKSLSDKIRKEAFNERIKGIEKKEHLIKLLHDELKQILGEKKILELKKGQNRILLLGLYGSGKTTTSAKLANYYAKRGKKTAIVGLDVHRPAAKEQLVQLGKQHNLTVFVDMDESNPIKTWEKFEEKLKKYEVVIIDTAGRHTLDEELISEIKVLNKLIKPTETVLVIPADLGQSAKKLSSEFKSALNISGVIITRMDSSAKGGGALTACAETSAGVYFITNGEKINDLEPFDPDSFLSRLLGMGDLNALIERIKSITDEKKQKSLEKSIKEGKLSLEDVIEQMKSMQSMGGFGKLKSLIPGMSSAKIPENLLEKQQKKISKWEHIVKSMTPQERENPELLEKQTSRISRIAKGSGVHNSDVRSLLKQYKMLKEMMRSSPGISEGSLNQKQLQKLIKKFGKRKFI